MCGWPWLRLSSQTLVSVLGFTDPNARLVALVALCLSNFMFLVSLFCPLICNVLYSAFSLYCPDYGLFVMHSGRQSGWIYSSSCLCRRHDGQRGLTVILQGKAIAAAVSEPMLAVSVTREMPSGQVHLLVYRMCTSGFYVLSIWPDFGFLLIRLCSSLNWMAWSMHTWKMYN